MLKNIIFPMVFLFSIIAFGESKRTDLSTGVVFPSDNSATYINSAQLIRSNQTLEFLLGTDNSDFEGTFVGGASSFGYGLGARSLADQLSILGGIGFDVGVMNLGFNVTHNLDASSTSVDAGFGFGGNSGMAFGIVLRDLTDEVSSIVAGIGYANGSLKIEVDGEYVRSSEVWFIDPALSVTALGDKLTVMLGYRYSEASNNGNFRFGISYWLQQFALEYLNDFFLGEHTLGIKIEI